MSYGATVDRLTLVVACVNNMLFCTKLSKIVWELLRAHIVQIVDMDVEIACDEKFFLCYK